jgi:hypothetical protein
LKRPYLYPHLFRTQFRKIIRLLFKEKSNLNETKKEACQWCSKFAVETDTALLKIVGKEKCISIEEIYPDVFAYAHQKYESCPVHMGGGSNINLIYWITEICEAEKVVETGVAFGWSSLAFLLSLQKRTESQ